MSFLVRFEGGTEDGKTRVLEHLARRYMVPKRPDNTATVEDYALINIDEVWNPPTPKYVVQVYRLEKRDDPDTGARSYVFVFEKEE